MSKIDQYIHAATRENTRISYQSAIRHFEETWEGFLPATADSVTRYLANYADTLAISTLKQRLAALSQWHIDQGFPDPTKASMVKKVLKGNECRSYSLQSTFESSVLDQRTVCQCGCNNPLSAL